MQAAYVDLDNDRYGIVRDMIPLQDDTNKRMSKFLHQASSNRWRASGRFQQDAATLKKELAKPDGIVIGDPGDIESLDTLGKDQGQFLIYQARVATLKGNIGPNAYLQGKAGENQSGKAVLAQQQAGMVEVTPLLDNLRHFTLRVYRQIWNRIRQYWTEARWIRVTGDDKNVRFVGINQPPELAPDQAMAAMQMIQMHVQAGSLDPQTAQQYAQQVQQKMQVQNHVAELDVDIEIDEVNETPTLQAEQFEQLATMIGQMPMLAQNPKVIEVLIKASNLRDKQQLIDILDESQQQAAQNPMQQLQMAGAQAQVENTQADTHEKQSKTMLNAAKAQATGAGVAIDAFQAGTQALQPPPPAF
jgi:hypothetical protein